MDLELSGKVAIVTGASKGIGREVVLTLAHEGADVVACARGRAGLDQLQADVAGRTGRSITLLAADLTESATATRLLETTMDSYGRVDVLVNNVGLATPQRLNDVDESDWKLAFDANFFSAVRCSLACLPHMRAQHGGRIINLSSTTAREPDPWFVPYSAAKAALVNFSKNLANMCAPDGVLVTCVMPGLTRTELTESNLESAMRATGQDRDEVVAKMLARAPIPMGRLGEPAEVAAAVAFLASARAGWITGTTLVVDGGTVKAVP